MINIPFDYDLYHRCNRAIVSTKTIRNRANAIRTADAVRSSLPVLNAINNAREYITLNIGLIPPVQYPLVFGWDIATAQRLEKARESLRTLFYLLPSTERKEVKGEHACISELLKDLQSHIVQMRKKSK